MELKLFAADWHGIPLTEVAAEVGMRPGELADARLYRRLYEIWRARGYAASPEWVVQKRGVAALIRDAVGQPGGVALSVGAGLGLVERALADSGWAVELQECQDISFDEARRSWNPKTWITDGLSTIPAPPRGGYGVILFVSSTYAMPRPVYRSMLCDAWRLLRPGGFVVIWEHDARVSLRPKRGVFWGWVRPPGVHVRLAKESGFDLVSLEHLDRRLHAVAPGIRLFGFQSPVGRSLAQLLIFRRRPDQAGRLDSDAVAFDSLACHERAPSKNAGRVEW